MSFFVRFWGVRGSLPTPGWQTRRYGGNTACIELVIDGVRFICDAGTGIRELGNALLREAQGPIKAHMFFSHPHWDHIQGFPFFAPLYMKQNTFLIYGRQAGDSRHYDLLSGQMKSDYFPVEFSDLHANISPAHLTQDGAWVDGTYVSWLPQVHPGGSVAYKFEKDGIKVVYSTDNEIDRTIENPDEVSRDPRAERRVSPRYIDFIRGADLLIADGQYTDDEYRTKIGWGHPRATTIVDAAMRAGVKRLAITHHDPMQTDEAVDLKIDACRQRVAAAGRELVVFAAREQVVLRLDRVAAAA